MDEVVLPPGSELKVVVDGQMLYKVVRFASGIAEKTAVVSVPSVNVTAVEATGERVAHLRVQAIAPDMTFTAILDKVTMEEGGGFTVPAADFAKVLRLSKGEVELSISDGETIRVRNNRTIWNLAGSVEVADYVATDPTYAGTFDGDELRTAVRAVAPAVPDHMARPVLNRVRIDSYGATATNGSMLLRHNLGVPDDFTLDIPRRALSVIQQSKSEEIVAYRTKNASILSMGPLEVLLPDSMLQYPDVSRVIQAAGLGDLGLLIVDAKEFSEAVDRVRIHADPSDPRLHIRMVKDTEAWRVFILAQDKSGKLARERLDASWQAGVKYHGAFNPDHLKAILSGCGEGDVTIRLGMDHSLSFLIEDEVRGLTAVTSQIV